MNSDSSRDNLPTPLTVTATDRINTPRGGIPKINTQPVQNRLRALMMHTARYAFKGESRLAKDAGVSKSAVCRLINGQSTPSFPLVAALTTALENRLPKPLDLRDVVSLDGIYPTPSVCAAAGCKGCLPDDAYHPDNTVKAEWKGVAPGQWTGELPPTNLGRKDDGTSSGFDKRNES